MENHNLKEKMLGEYYEYSLPDIAEKLFMHVNTASNLERSAIAKFKTELQARGLTVMDLLE
jgi:DNA-binding CsgD family transcriptional regulator